MPHDGSGFPDPWDTLSYAEQNIHPCLSHWWRGVLGKNRRKITPLCIGFVGIFLKEITRGRIK